MKSMEVAKHRLVLGKRLRQRRVVGSMTLMTRRCRRSRAGKRWRARVRTEEKGGRADHDAHPEARHGVLEGTAAWRRGRRGTEDVDRRALGRALRREAQGL